MDLLKCARLAAIKKDPHFHFHGGANLGCGNLWVFRIMSSSIPTKTCEYAQLPALHKNIGYRSCGRSYKSKYPYAIKIESINNIDGVLFLNTYNTLISV